MHASITGRALARPSPAIIHPSNIQERTPLAHTLVLIRQVHTSVVSTACTEFMFDSAYLGYYNVYSDGQLAFRLRRFIYRRQLQVPAEQQPLERRNWLYGFRGLCR
jgi:hypothetical protein